MSWPPSLARHCLPFNLPKEPLTRKWPFGDILVESWHATIAHGGCLRIQDGWKIQRLEVPMGDCVWILADSGEPKDTLRHLYRCKEARLELLEHVLGGSWDNSNFSSDLTSDQERLRQATLTTRDTEKQAFELWTQKDVVDRSKRLGELMSRHQEALRDGLGLSTAILDCMEEKAMNAGAWGFKLVGSGGGGCGVAWTSQAQCHDVERALQEAGATQTFVFHNCAEGAHIRTI